jgi:hypothetical protein
MAGIRAARIVAQALSFAGNKKWHATGRIRAPAHKLILGDAQIELQVNR